MPNIHPHPRSGHAPLSSKTSRWVILAVVIGLVGILLWVKHQNPSAQPGLDEPAEAQFDRNLQQQKPMLAFFHSTDCHSCIEMMKLVDEVYPPFQEKVALVDVNVYDPANQNLLRRARILSIPTQIFIGQDGRGKVFLGVMSKEQLQQELQQLAEEPR
ncbi:thioredoxin family protein [uncultured Thermanaerothrix sp.]|uniref:thioredoxin family protein n=1 Tax=uncultured Thermanaerothrix sp. TaxID=1195149 RepID=UPI00262A8DA1|nr:thioredoxin family protein [uncultured Thermanaerothrix sp.]